MTLTQIDLDLLRQDAERAGLTTKYVNVPSSQLIELLDRATAAVDGAETDEDLDALEAEIDEHRETISELRAEIRDLEHELRVVTDPSAADDTTDVDRGF